MSFAKSKIVMIIAGLVLMTAVFGGWEAQTIAAQTQPVTLTVLNYLDATSPERIVKLPMSGRLLRRQTRILKLSEKTYF